MKHRISHKVHVVKEWSGTSHIILLKFWKNVGAIIIINYLPIRTIATTLAFPAELVNTPRMSSDVSEDTKNGVIFNIA